MPTESNLINSFYTVDTDIEKRLCEISDYLKTIYPFLNNDSFNKECLEIRPVRRVKGSYLKSLNLWRLDTKGIEQLRKFLYKINGQPFCIYYSGYVMDYNKKTYTKEGKPSEKGKINNKNAIYTQILPMDFDGLSINEFEEQIKNINDLGIKTINIFSGHGFQSIILLDQPSYDINLYKKFTNLLLTKGFKVDPKIIDPARVLRLPFTFNYKEFDKSKYNLDKPKAKATTILNYTDERYFLEYIFKSLDKLETIHSEHIARSEIKAPISFENVDKHVNVLEGVKQKNTGQIKGQYDAYNYIGKEYYMINFNALPEPIKLILTETPENYRNSVYFFLVPFLKNKIGLSLNKVIRVMKVFASRCNPPLEADFMEKEVVRLWNYNYEGFGAYTKELAEKFGYLVFEEYKLNNEIAISNILYYRYPELHETSIRIYYLLKADEKINNNSEWNINKIADICDVSVRTIKKYIKNLLDTKLIHRRTREKLTGSYIYYFKNSYNKTKGFTKISISTIENIYFNKRNPLNNTEAKLYTYMYYMLHNNPVETCFASQEYLAQQIGKSRARVCELTNMLVNKKYIYKDKFFENNNEHCLYNLLK